MSDLRNARGQSTVELALCLPALAILMGLVVEVALVASDQARLWHAAREGARVAVVDPDESAVRDAVERSGLEGIHLSIDPESGYRVQGHPLEVELTYQTNGHVPIVGELFDDMELHSTATMRIEEP